MASKKASSKTTKEPVRQVTGVKYVGAANTKILNQGDVAKHGYDTSTQLATWNSQNDHFVGISEIDDPMLRYLRSQPDFRVVYG